MKTNCIMADPAQTKDLCAFRNTISCNHCENFDHYQQENLPKLDKSKKYGEPHKKPAEA